MELGNIKLLISIVFFYCVAGNIQANELLDDANKSLDYLRDNVIYSDFEDFSGEKTVAAIRALSLAINHVELDKKSSILLKRIRALASNSLNSKRMIENETVDVSLAMRALKDIEYVLKEDINNKNSRLLYLAGHIALHQIKDTPLAYDFWTQCAVIGHAGCMNAIAEESFTGMNGLTINTKKSIFWHKKVFETGSEFNCAGLFSANTLSNLAFFFPELEADGDWMFWRKQRDSLLMELESKPDYVDICGKSSLYLRDYVIDIVAGYSDSTKLAQAISAVSDDVDIYILESIERDTTLNETFDLLVGLPNANRQCSFTFNLLLLSKYQGKIEISEKLEDHFYMLDKVTCSTELEIIQRLRDLGRW